VLALVPLAAALSGCGWLAGPRPFAAGGDGPRLTRAAFVEQAEAACARRSRAITVLPRPSSAAERRVFFARVATLLRLEFGALAALRPPTADEREFGDLLRASGELTQIAARFHLAVVRDDAHVRRRALADAERASEAYDRAARRLRLACRHAS
jgi:hypothetical protein